ncbi:SDR family oxidoreductase [Granulicella sp. 5B5]|uniref:enoyl-ACP reductase FabI n=1 Tax=Granulicella sp. 5B5 TaxID=1617967 RepID=UPI0015F4F29E|nr:enoyl-ACP reductase [Granulicella sp. 5B5]QMV19838.1 SDR family oxidoreductase [Granulicella sp. 5B5]
MIDMKGKVAVVLGVANKRSIAYAIAEKLAAAGATLVLCYQSERLKKESEDLIAELGQTGKARAIQMDVTKDSEIETAFQEIAAAFPVVHILVHSVAFAPADAMKNDFLLTKREDFAMAQDISVYSLIAVARAATPLMTEGGSIITMTHYGSDKVFPNYNVMGVAKAALEAAVRYLAASLGGKNIRVNAISAGAIKTLAARGIGDLQVMLDKTSERAPLHRNVEQSEVGKTALFLASDLASGITGEVMFVDCGFNITGI